VTEQLRLSRQWMLGPETCANWYADSDTSELPIVATGPSPAGAENRAGFYPRSVRSLIFLKADDAD
jgi:hypothetical protein